jgi:hypothetical protein
MSLQPRKMLSIVSVTLQASIGVIRTSFIFDKCAHIFGMMDIAIIQYENASWAWIRISKAGDIRNRHPLI